MAKVFSVSPITAAAAEAFDASVTGSINLTLTMTISFKAITSANDLQVDSKTDTTRNDYRDLEVRIGGLGKAFPDDLHKSINEWSEKISENYRNAKQQYGDEVKKFDKLFSGVAATLKSELNHQNKFIFLGDGGFDMKDPIFSDEGDLMVGLTYRRL